MSLDTISKEDTLDQWRVKDNAAISLLNTHDETLQQVQSGILNATSVTYYVRTDGNDSNTGLENTAGGAFKTVQAAVNAAYKRNVSNGTSITISVANGTYTGSIVASGTLAGSLTTADGTGWSAPIIITGASGVILTSSNAAATLTVGPKSVVRLAGGLRIQSSGTTGTRHGIAVSGGGILDLNAMFFGACAGDHINVSQGGIVLVSANYNITGSAARHIAASSGSLVVAESRTIALSTTPAFTQFINSTGGSVVIYSGHTFTGSATGSRYSATNGGSIITSSGSTTYLPGNAAGSLSSGGSYDNLFVLGKLDSTDIGSTTPGTGAFTTLSASGAATVNSLSSTTTISAGGKISGDSLEVTAGVTGATGSFSTSLTASGSTELRGTVYLGGSAIGNESFRVTTVASAVNRLVARGGATGVPAALYADGETNSGLDVWSKGTGSVRLGTNSSLLVLELLNVNSAVNNWTMSAGTTGSAVVLKPAGSDANIPAWIEGKGTSSVFFRTSGGSQFETRHRASAVNRGYVQGGATGGSVTYGVDGETNISLVLQPKGSGTVQANGSFIASGNVTAYSDEKLKTNWRDLPENFVEKLAKIKSGIFDRNDTNETQVGVSAQSLKRLLPHAVIKTGKWLSVSYGNAAMVACVELAKRLITQQKEINDLKSRLDKLEKAAR